MCCQKAGSAIFEILYLTVFLLSFFFSLRRKGDVVLQTLPDSSHCPLKLGFILLSRNYACLLLFYVAGIQTSIRESIEPESKSK